MYALRSCHASALKHSIWYMQVVGTIMPHTQAQDTDALTLEPHESYVTGQRGIVSICSSADHKRKRLSWVIQVSPNVTIGSQTMEEVAGECVAEFAIGDRLHRSLLALMMGKGPGARKRFSIRASKRNPALLTP